MASTVTIALADGRGLEGRAENGMLESGELDDKFLRPTRRTIGIDLSMTHRASITIITKLPNSWCKLS